MFTNKDITVFSFNKNEYVRTEIRKVFWNEHIERTTTDNGLVLNKKVNVFIPMSSMPGKFAIKTGDVVLKGIVKYSPVANEEKAISEWHRYIEKQYDAHTVTAISIHDYGSIDMQHIEVVMN